MTRIHGSSQTVVAGSMDKGRSYLELSQFLDLERRWMDAAGAGELAHRICRTANLLLGTADVAILLRKDDDRLESIADEAASSTDRRAGSLQEALARRALSSGTAQVKSLGDSSLGIFPFTASAARPGCLVVRVERPLFEGKEVSFLRFLASLTGIMLAGNGKPAPPPAPQEEQARSPLAATRRHVAMAVHDLRNPLNVLAGYSDLLADGSLGSLSEDQARAVDAIQRQVHVLTAAVDQLIDLDRMSRGVGAGEHESFCLRDVFEQLRATCFLGLDERIDWPKEESAFETTGDRRRIASIVQNLVDNALRHGGNQPVRVDGTRRDGQLLLRVRDGGAGLSAKARASLMAWASGHEPSEPTGGLGLCIIGSAVHALGGRIDVRNAEGGGTVIEVHLSAAEKRTPSAEAAAVSGGQRNGG